jgi:hypothetical protein
VTHSTCFLTRASTWPGVARASPSASMPQSLPPLFGPLDRAVAAPACGRDQYYARTGAVDRHRYAAVRRTLDRGMSTRYTGFAGIVVSPPPGIEIQVRPLGPVRCHAS